MVSIKDNLKMELNKAKVSSFLEMVVSMKVLINEINSMEQEHF
jgi:hypothetical protein